MAVYTRPHLSDLCTLLAPIAHKYYAIGIVLKVPMDTLGLAYSPDAYQDNLKRTLEWWLDNGDKPTINSPVTWENIISAIEGPVVQNYSLAREIRHFVEMKKIDQEPLQFDIQRRKDIIETEQLVRRNIAEQGELNITIAKAILYGPPKVGKTIVMKRLLGEKFNHSHSPSTTIDAPVTVPVYKNLKTASVLVGEWKAQENWEETLQICLNYLSESATLSSPDEPTPTDPPLSFDSTATGPPDITFPNYQETPTLSDPVSSLIQSCLSEGNWKDLSERLKYIENATLLQMIDVGGQPEFHEILPLLLNGPALYLLFLNLTQNVDELYTYKYRYKDKSSSRVYRCQLTTQEVLHRVLSSTASSCSQKSAAMLIGTYLDKFKKKHCHESDSDEVVKAKVKKKVESSLKELTSYHEIGILKKFYDEESDDEHILLPVNNISGTFEAEIKPLQDHIKQALISMKRSQQKQPLPTKWALFYFLLRDFPKRKGGNRFCTLEHASKIAKGLQIEGEEVKEALKYIHQCFGSVLFYHDVFDDDGTRYVLCDPNVILKPIADLVVSCFGSNSFLRDTGLIDYRTLSDLYKGSVPLNYLIALLQKRFIISQKVQTDEDVHYFVPSLLHVRDKTEEINPPVCSEVAPLLLTFVLPQGQREIRYVPPGLFSALLVELSSTQMWSLETGKKKRYKSEESFIFGDDKECTRVQLLAQPYWLEVQILEHPVPLLCAKIFQSIRYGIEKIKSNDSMLQDYLKSVELEIGFYCPNSHYARQRNPTQMECTSDCPRKLNDLDTTHEIWFSKLPEAEQVAQANMCILLESRPQLTELYTLLDNVSDQYDKIGGFLGVPNTIDGLDPRLSNFHNLSTILRWWLNNGDNPTNGARSVTWGNIIDVIENRLNYEVAIKMKECLQRKGVSSNGNEQAEATQAGRKRKRYHE